MKTEHVFIALLVLAIVAVAIFRFPVEEKINAVLDAAEEPDANKKSAKGRAYLVYNQPYRYCPPNGSIYPTRARSLLGVKTYDGQKAKTEAKPKSA